jgi:hypothetical protein
MSLEYSPLAHPRHIRLLQLEPGCFEDEISCHIVHVNLMDSPSYAALSYVWGNPQVTNTARCNGRLVNITINLKAALKRLRHPSETVPCWVDALCINQSDIDERNKQVMLMGSIYSQALNVAIYLGEENANCEQVFIIMGVLRGATHDRRKSKEEIYAILNQAYFGGRGLALPPSYSPAWDAFQDFFRQDWFSRMWVFQEAVLAKNEPLFLYGERKIRWESVTSVAELYHSSGLRRSRPTHDLSFNLNLMNKFRRLRSDARSTIRLLQLLRHTRKFRATDPRDKFFALYGLASEQFPINKDVFKPDYHMVASDVFCDVTAKLVEVDGDLDVLSYAGTSSSSAGVADLPSWVPDWTAETELDILGTGSDESGYCACLRRDLPREIRISEDHRTLEISGAFVDQISWNSVAFTQPFSDMLPDFRNPGFLRKIWQEKVESLGPDYTRGGTTAEAFWKTLIANIGENREPVTDDYFVHFLSYWRLSRLRDYEADMIMGDRGVRPSFDDINARRDALKKESESNFYNQDQVDAIKRQFVDELSKLNLSCTCPRREGVFPDTSDGVQQEDAEQCSYCRVTKDPPWEAVVSVPYPLRLDDPTLDMMDDLFIDEWFRRLRSDIRDPISILDSPANIFGSAIARGISNRSFFMTSSNLIGIGPPELKVGDQIAILAGAQMPFVLRLVPGEASGQQSFRLIGESYVHGVMDGSFVQFDDKGEPRWTTIRIV